VVDVEALRARFQPERIRILFVGESLPAGGTFFYNGDSNLVRYTCEAFAAALGTPDGARSFPSVFRDHGCYLVDLRREPVNGLSRAERQGPEMRVPLRWPANCGNTALNALWW